MKMQTMENQLFTWSGWDQMDTATFQFYEPVLVVPIGEFPVGQKFSYAVLDYENSLLQLAEDGEGKVYHEFELKLKAFL